MMHSHAQVAVDSLIEAAELVPVVVKGAIPKNFRAAVLDRLSTLPTSSWQVGDETDHSWSEYHIDQRQLRKWCANVDFLSAAMQRASTAVGWINRFCHGEWIGPHKDAGGDLQLVCTLCVCSRVEEGAIWIRKPDRLIPMAAGDILIFRAADLVHGTTDIASRHEERVTLNLRLWF